VTIPIPTPSFSRSSERASTGARCLPETRIRGSRPFRQPCIRARAERSRRTCWGNRPGLRREGGRSLCSAQGANSAPGQSGGLSDADQLAFASAEYDQRFGPSPGTVDAVALATLDEYNPISVSQNREYAGLTYEYGGSVGVTPGAPGAACTSTGCSSYPMVWARHLPTGSRILAYWHTHGGPPPAGFSSDFFSPADVNLANTVGGGYVGTPAGNAYFIRAGAIPNPPNYLTNQFLQTITQTQRYLGPVPVR
jgi:hypothetical protein